MRSKIVDEAQWADEVARQRSCGMHTNLYAPAEEFFPLITQGRLFRERFLGGTYYFAERQQQVDCYFFLERGASPVSFAAWEKPVILQQVALAGKGPAPAADAWAAIGFAQYLQRRRLSLPSARLQERERTVEFAAAEEAEIILEWMQEVFEPYTSALPDRETLLRDLHENRVIAARREGELLGFLRFGREKRVSVLRQIAVRQAARGQGLGERLLLDWFSLEMAAVSKFQLWVREDNPSAWKLYEKSGFQPDGRIAPVMIKE